MLKPNQALVYSSTISAVRIMTSLSTSTSSQILQCARKGREQQRAMDGRSKLRTLCETVMVQQSRCITYVQGIVSCRSPNSRGHPRFENCPRRMPPDPYTSDIHINRYLVRPMQVEHMLYYARCRECTRRECIDNIYYPRIITLLSGTMYNMSNYFPLFPYDFRP